jgi:hypothetical protein
MQGNDVSLCIKCNEAETVNPLPEGGGSVSFDQLYCAACLKEETESGRLNPMQIPFVDDRPHGDQGGEQI